MINITVPAASPLRELAEQLPRKYRVAFRKVVEEEAIPAIQALYIRDLVEDTPPRRTPSSPVFVWSRNNRKNAKARGWWFANIRQGNIPTDGHNYIRSGKLQLQWRVYGKVTTDQAIIQLINRSKGAEWVYGNDQHPQIPGHRTTGWKSVNRQAAGKKRSLDTLIRKIANRIGQETGRLI